MCTEKCGCSQELFKEDFDPCTFWKSGSSALAPESKISFRDTDYHSLPRLLHLPKAGTRLKFGNNTALNLGKPVAFFLEGSVALNFHSQVSCTTLCFSFKKSILKGLLGKPGSYIHPYGQKNSISSVNRQVRLCPIVIHRNNF